MLVNPVIIMAIERPLPHWFGENKGLWPLKSLPLPKRRPAGGICPGVLLRLRLFCIP